MRIERLWAIAVLALAAAAQAGVLLDYGYRESFNDAGVVRGVGAPTSVYGFEQFQSFVIPDAAWRLDSATLHIRLWNVASAGEAELAIYADDHGSPALAAPIAGAVALRADSLSTQPVLVDLGGMVLTGGTYYVALAPASATTDILWMPGTANAARHALRSDGQMYTYYNPAFSLNLEGEVVPGAATSALFAAAAVAGRGRR